MMLYRFDNKLVITENSLEEGEYLGEIEESSIITTSDIPEGRLKEVYNEILMNGKLEEGEFFFLNIRGEVIEGTIRYIDGDYIIYRRVGSLISGKELPVIIN